MGNMWLPVLRSTRLLPVLLSLIAGSSDATSFLGLGLFSAHVTGNLVILAAYIVGRRVDAACLILSVPIFILVLGLARLLAAGLEALGRSALQPLLLLQFLMLGGSLVLGLSAGPRPLPETRAIIVAGELCVAAMAVQHALVALSLHGSPTTAVMTTNLTRFVMDIGEAVLGHDPARMAEARHRARHTWPVILGFTAGAGLGAVCFAAAGLTALGLPTALALIALAMGRGTQPVGETQE